VQRRLLPHPRLTSVARAAPHRERSGHGGILVRTSVEPESLLNSARREIWAVDRNVALTLTGTLESYLKQFSYTEPRFTLTLGMVALRIN